MGGDVKASSGGSEGAQRLSLGQLEAWESWGYGMFIHFGMSTFLDEELPDGRSPASVYAPDRLDVDQWVQVARDAGMSYAVLTAKHVAGHCLWPSSQTDYHVGRSGETTDVVGAFVAACEKHGIRPGLYYCSWDNHHRLGSRTPSRALPDSHAYTTRAYRDFQLAQVHELLTRYGKIAEVWIDIPGVLGFDGRIEQYEQIAALQPEAVIMLNTGFGDGSDLKLDYAWPSDLVAIERWLPPSNGGHLRWREIGLTKQKRYRGVSDYVDEPDPPQRFYVPGEVCDPIGQHWFWSPGDPLRSDQELLGMRLISRSRHTNLLLNVPPDRSGRIPSESVEALMRLKRGAGLAGVG